MKTRTTVLLVAGLLASALTAAAQINNVNARQINHVAETLVLGLTASSSGTFSQGLCTWTSPSAPASLSAGNTMSGGPFDGYTFGGGYPILYCSGGNLMSNASGRGVIRGKNNNSGTASILFVQAQSTNAVTVVIWGPTLNGFGLTGASNFTWEIYAGNSQNPYYNSGSGEASFTIPQSKMASGAAAIFFTPSDDDELGSVMVNFNN